MSGITTRQQTIQHLAQQLRQVERTRKRPGAGGESLSTGIPGLDRLLPERGFPPGTLVEWLSSGTGSGTGTLAFQIAANILRKNENCVVIDPHQTFFPVASGVDRMIVVHPLNEREALWAWEQSLRCSGVAVVMGWLDQLPNQTYRRLQLAAETGGAMGFLLRPAIHRSQPAWADVRFRVESLPTKELDSGRRLTVEMVHCRGRAGGGILKLDMDDETGDVRVVPELAAATHSVYSAGA